VNFNVYPQKIRVFAKLSPSSGKASSPTTYYCKDLPKECPVTFTFTEQDEIAKVHGK